jgi:hypothetical protein
VKGTSEQSDIGVRLLMMLVFMTASVFGAQPTGKPFLEEALYPSDSNYLRIRK